MCYPAESRRDVWCKIPMGEGYAMICGSLRFNPHLSLKISGGGYLKSEIENVT
jgi:hypothetical protein